jgi:signal transduction histidine kinase
MMTQVFLIYKFLKLIDSEEETIINFDIFVRIHTENELELIFKDITLKKQIDVSKYEIKQKTLYLAKSAHELKNPVLCVQELVEQLYEIYLKRGKKINDLDLLSQIFSLIPQIKSLSNYILILVKDLDYFSQKQLGNSVSFDMHECRLEDVLKFCKDVSKALLRKYGKNEKVTFNIIRPSLCTMPEVINTDEWRLKQIIINLISNSIKFTDFGKIDLEIQYSLVNDQPSFKFIISDTGRGIPNEEQHKLFRPFNKGSESQNNEIGSGLGLSIVNDLSKRLGLPIEFSSKVGKGSSFWFTVCNKQKTKSYQSFYNKNLDTKPVSNCDESVITLKLENIDNFDFQTTKELNKSINNDSGIYLKGEFKTFERKNEEYNIIDTNICENLNEEYQNLSPKRLSESQSSHNSTSPNNKCHVKRKEKRKESINIQNINIYNSIPCQQIGSDSFIFKSITNRVTTRKKSSNINFIDRSSEKVKTTILRPFSNTEEINNLVLNSSGNDNVKYIIVCDDTNIIRESTNRILSKVAHNLGVSICILEAEDGIECLYIIYKCIRLGLNISFVLSDDNMGFIKGIKSAEILNTMLNEMKMQPIPFFLISAFSFENDFKKQYSPKIITDFIIKPLKTDHVEKIFTSHAL